MHCVWASPRLAHWAAHCLLLLESWSIIHSQYLSHVLPSQRSKTAEMQTVDRNMYCAQCLCVPHHLRALAVWRFWGFLCVQFCHKLFPYDFLKCVAGRTEEDFPYWKWLQEAFYTYNKDTTFPIGFLDTFCYWNLKTHPSIWIHLKKSTYTLL